LSDDDAMFVDMAITLTNRGPHEVTWSEFSFTMDSMLRNPDTDELLLGVSAQALKDNTTFKAEMMPSDNQSKPLMKFQAIINHTSSDSATVGLLMMNSDLQEVWKGNCEMQHADEMYSANMEMSVDEDFFSGDEKRRRLQTGEAATKMTNFRMPVNITDGFVNNKEKLCFTHFTMKMVPEDSDTKSTGIVSVGLGPEEEFSNIKFQWVSKSKVDGKVVRTNTTAFDFDADVSVPDRCIKKIPRCIKIPRATAERLKQNFSIEIVPPPSGACPA